MLPGSRSGRINYASYRLNGYFQASSPGYFTRPRQLTRAWCRQCLQAQIAPGFELLQQ